MAFMNRYDGGSKFQSLVGALAACDRRRSYYLSLATCYCAPKAVGEFIDAIRAELNITEVFLYLDRRTAIAIGHAQLAKLEEDYSDVLSIYAVKARRLFHTKGYCLAAYADDDIVHGRLAIGSANLTGGGLTESHGNVESLAIHSDIPTIRGFLSFFDNEDNLITLERLTEFSPDDTTDFQYAVLTTGLFSHKWSAALASYISVRYQLNAEGRQRAQEGIATPGFRLEAASIGKSYFDFDVQPWRPHDDNLVKNWGIETFLGHWIPKSVIHDATENNELFNRFREALFNNLDSKMDSMCRRILQDYDSLIHEGIIDAPEADPTQSFRERLEALGNDDDQLYRIWSGRHFFDFPYDVSEVQSIQETFEDLLRSVHRRQRRNKTMKAVLEAEQGRTLEPLRTLSRPDE